LEDELEIFYLKAAALENEILIEDIIILIIGGEISTVMRLSLCFILEGSLTHIH
jgi:hypothetical protein